MKHFKDNWGQLKFDLTSGLQGIDLEVAKTRLSIGTTVRKLIDNLWAKKTPKQEICDVIEHKLGLAPAHAQLLEIIDRNYHHPTNPDLAFKYYYLASVDAQVLKAFLPYLSAYRIDPSAGLGPYIWLSPKSIEVHLPDHTGVRHWHDLKTLTLDDVKNLSALVNPVPGSGGGTASGITGGHAGAPAAAPPTAPVPQQVGPPFSENPVSEMSIEELHELFDDDDDF